MKRKRADNSWAQLFLSKKDQHVVGESAEKGEFFCQICAALGRAYSRKINRSSDRAEAWRHVVNMHPEHKPEHWGTVLRYDLNG